MRHINGIENGRARTLRGSTRGAILAAAEQLFAARGYKAATIQEIARGAGVSRGAPAYFFGDGRCEGFRSPQSFPNHLAVTVVRVVLVAPAEAIFIEVFTV